MVEAALGGDARYRLLDIVRSYASDQLESDGEADAATERFLQWALQLAAWIDHTTDTDQEPLADRVRSPRARQPPCCVAVGSHRPSAPTTPPE